MRKCVTLLLLVGSAWPAMAARTMSVEQLEQLLAALQGKADAHVAQQLSEVELEERVSPERLARWGKDFTGSRTREALMRLADAAAFLKTPALDVIPIAPPDSDTQEKMIALASDYVKTTMTRLPNFYATRETTHFEDAPSQEQAATTGTNSTGWRLRPLGIAIGKTESKPLHSTGSYSTMVTYRDGREVDDTEGSKDGKENQAPAGLTTSGEFGPILALVIEDAMRGQVTWSHWEQSAGDPMAVLRYAVPEDQSNYAVGIPNGTNVERVYPGYHGEIAIDPATGSVFRISVVADLTGPYQTMRTEILVEYAPVAIGDRTYFCPVHGVTYSKVPVAGPAQDPQGSTLTVQTQVNDVAFTHYHLFRSEAHMVGGGDGKSEATAPAARTSGAPAAAAPGDHAR
ncbi:MAG: hypothetical protein WB341_11320 [Terracidiphilus sp.]